MCRAALAVEVRCQPHVADNDQANGRPSCLFCYSRPWQITSVQDERGKWQGQLVKMKASVHSACRLGERGTKLLVLDMMQEQALVSFGGKSACAL